MSEKAKETSKNRSKKITKKTGIRMRPRQLTANRSTSYTSKTALPNRAHHGCGGRGARRQLARNSERFGTRKWTGMMTSYQSYQRYVECVRDFGTNNDANPGKTSRADVMSLQALLQQKKRTKGAGKIISPNTKKGRHLFRRIFRQKPRVITSVSTQRKH